MKKGRLLLVILTLVLTFSLMTLVSFADDSDESSGKCGENAVWTLSDDGTLTISGTGELEETAFGDNNKIVNVIIEDGITNISYGVFLRCSGLESITIPDSVTEIGARAFEECTSLKNVTIPDSVTDIDDDAFMECTSLESINIPDGITSIESGVFWKCTSLTTISIPESVVSIGDAAFADCNSLTSIRIPKNVTNIGVNVFSGCKNLEDFDVDADNPAYDNRNGCNAIIETDSNTLIAGGSKTTIPDRVTALAPSAFAGRSAITSITIPDSVTSIGYQAFSECENLTSITIPDNVTEIGRFAFNDCTALESITLSEKLESIGECAFWGCSSLRSITIPKHVTSIEAGSLFHDCSNLGTIIVDTDNPVYDSRNDCNAIIETASNTLLEGGYKTVIPDGVAAIGEDAFAGRSRLTSIIIPDSVKTIDEFAFSGCTGLKDITLPEKMTSIGRNAFSSCSMTSFTVPQGIKRLEYGLLDGCSSMTEVRIPESVTTIDIWVFNDCSSLTDVYYEGSSQQWSQVEKREYKNECLANATIHFAKADSQDGSHKHSYGAWSVITPATELAAGQQSRKCSVCGNTETQEIAQLGPTLKSMKLLKAKAAKKSATVKWKKIPKKNLKKIRKVQIQYSTDKNFKKAVKTKYAKAKKTSYKIKGLKKGRKYYVRIRAYTKAGGKVHVSKWSKSKSFKVK